MTLTDEEIWTYSPKQLFAGNTLDALYDIEDEADRARFTALLQARAQTLNMDKQFTNVIKKYNEANKKLSDEYTKMYAEYNAEIPLKFNDKGVPINSIENFLLILRNDDYFKDLKYNCLSHCPEKNVNGKIERWGDADDSKTRQYIESKYHIHQKDKLDDALRIFFKEREYHPIKNIIDAVKWDGVDRIKTMFIKWLKCEDTEYTKEVTRLFFAGGINRLYNPGCKFDDMPVFIGTKQGEGKSTFIRWLAIRDDFFAEVGEFEGQKGIEALEGAWICEVSELLALTKVKDQEAVKSYLTKISDKYRKPFDKRVTENKRQCVFVGTTNKTQFLTDKTGNRRFYPLKVYSSGYDIFDFKEPIQHDVLQCWAEAKAKLNTDEMAPYANRKLLDTIREQQSEAVEDDYREGLIKGYLEGKTETCIFELWKEALQEDYSKPTKRDSNDIALILQSLGCWEREKKTSRYKNYGVTRKWNRIVDETGFLKDSSLDELPF